MFRWTDTILVQTGVTSIADFLEYNVYFRTIPYKDLGQFSFGPLWKHLVFLSL